ncbi:hypothetical protein SCLCIDRAFT_1208289 [Scleroderma citrinum Foug A]|uniref:RING-type domain-containing protein n=1 Tax=Scleroderma citrinum Foug A TaxID=1036808 RepID=A0A0C3ENK1_9AGAM|nr:hypothetical protein SCLCIDRAFT_1208289 [Scleroderma citrinum Foug A]
MNLWGLLVSAFLLVVSSPAQAYTPAQPTNISSQGLGGTNTNKLTLQWYSNGSDTEFVYYLLAGGATDGLSQGVLVHFSESNSSYGTTTTPWIAFISCDGNSTNASQELDIFTLARDSGAQAALLYSLSSDSCAINPAYTDPNNGFDHVFDIFATQALRVSNFIQYEYAQFGANGTYYGTYNATMLNEAASTINRSIASGSPVAPGLLFATLQTFNATAPPNNASSIPGGSAASTNNGHGNSQKTGLAMIILYAITGCVSALFCLVIISGAIRAIRHPERYGPRVPTHGAGDPGQSRARGLGRAMLDTFPVVKFGSSDQASDMRRPKDVEAPHTEMAVAPNIGQTDHVELEHVTGGARDSSEERGVAAEDPAGPALVGETTPTPRHQMTTTGIDPSLNPNDAVMPEAIGRETCPICIVDFEEGDDLRILPCEGKHRFHQTCVDPWLLELSGSCPICRQDFHALETIISGDRHSDQPGELQRSSQVFSPGGVQNRFSRYLRLARGRQNRHARSAGAGSDTPPS